MELKLEDLLTDCSAWGGKGEVSDAPVPKDMPWFVPGSHYTGPCMMCEGRGYFLTDAGEALEAFVRRIGPRP